MSLALVYLKDGETVESRDLHQIEGLVMQPDISFWLDLISPTADEMDWLGRTLNFHPLTLEDIREENPRPKLDDFPGYAFMVVHSAIIKPRELGLEEVHIFVSEQFIVTSHGQQLEEHEEFRHSFAERASWLRRGSDFCLYRLLDDLADGYLTVVNGIDDELDELQDEILVGGGLRSVDPIVTIRRQLATLRRIVSPMRELASELSLQRFTFMRRENSLYFRDLHGLLVTVFDLTETQRDVASNILDAHLSAISNRLSEVVKRLTIVATIFLPISFVASFGGMNFSFLPFASPTFFALVIASLVVIPVIMLVWFKREGWF